MSNIDNYKMKDVSKYKYMWRYEENNKPTNGCYDCGAAKFPNMVISDESWEKINPTHVKGAGILCPTCIANRLDYIDEWYMKDGQIWSGNETIRIYMPFNMDDSDMKDAESEINDIFEQISTRKRLCEIKNKLDCKGE